MDVKDLGTGAIDFNYSDRTTPAAFPIDFQALREGVEPPKMGSIHAAGYDLCAAEEVFIPMNETSKIPLGFATAMHPDIHCRIESRSGLALKGLVVLTGVIDADYRGEWNVILRNLNVTGYLVAKGDRIAQAVLRPTVRGWWGVVSELPDSVRGAGGFW